MVYVRSEIFGPHKFTTNGCYGSLAWRYANISGDPGELLWLPHETTVLVHICMYIFTILTTT
jgi:hypothetical protein